MIARNEQFTDFDLQRCKQTGPAGDDLGELSMLSRAVVIVMIISRLHHQVRFMHTEAHDGHKRMQTFAVLKCV